MKREAQDLMLRQILANEGVDVLRERSLDAMLTAARQRRHRRRLTRIGLCGAVPVLLFAVILASRIRHAPGASPTSPPPTLARLADTRTAPPKVEYLTDEQLLAMFPGRSLALVGPTGRQQLLFLDEQKGGRSGESSPDATSAFETP